MNKIQTLLSLTIGSVATAVVYNPPSVQAWDMATGFADMMNGIHDSLAPARTEAQTPLPVPQGQPPIGNSASIQPCAAPPPLPVAAVPDEGMPPESKFSAANLPSERPEPVASIQPAQPAQQVPPSNERTEYNQAGSITQAQADRMSRYKKPQSRKAMIALLGAPNWFDSDADVYRIEGSSDGGNAGRRLVVRYELDPESEFAIAIATGWRQE